MNKIKVLLIGSTGLLGNDIYRVLYSNPRIDLKIITRDECDITKKEQVNSSLGNLEFDYLINAAAYAKVDEAENDKKTCFEINVNGVQNLLDICELKNGVFIHFSSDYVFDGTLDKPYLENDDVNPISYYGLTKLLSEKVVNKYSKHFTIRTSWLFGINGENFITKILQASQKNNTMRIVSDQIGSPTYTWDLAKFIESLIINDILNFGTYHVTNEGYMSWYEFAEMIFKLQKISVNIEPVSSEESQSLAKRPKNSRLDFRKRLQINVYKMPIVIDALNRFLLELEISK